MTEKTVDVYDDEAVVANMKARYQAAESDAERAEVVSELAEELGKSEQSVRGKLVREKVYIAKTRADKVGREIVRKGELVDRIASAIGVEFTDGEAMSLEKATKSTLRKILDAVTHTEEKSEAA